MRCRYEQGWARRQARASREGQGEPAGRFPPELIREEGFGPHPEFRTLLVEEGGEAINMLHRRRLKPVHLRNPYGPEEPIFIPGDSPGSTTLEHQGKSP